MHSSARLGGERGYRVSAREVASADGWSLSTALAPIRIAPATLPARAIGHNLSVSCNLLRQSGPLERLPLCVVAPCLLFQHAVRVSARPIGSPKALAGSRVPVLPFSRRHTSGQGDAKEGHGEGGYAGATVFDGRMLQHSDDILEKWALDASSAIRAGRSCVPQARSCPKKSRQTLRQHCPRSKRAH